MCFDFLLLGHLLGDFTFQTDKIAENKGELWKWNLCHSIIVTCCILIFAVPFGSLILGLVLLNGVLHFVIDYYKSRLPDQRPLYSLFYFVVDQTVHILIIFLISSFYTGNNYISSIYRILADFLIVLVLISSFASIMIQYILRLIFVSYSESFFIQNEKNIGIITRTLIFFVLYSSRYFSNILLLITAVILIAKTVYYKKKWYSLMSPAYFYTGLLMDFLIPISMFYLVLEQ